MRRRAAVLALAACAAAACPIGGARARAADRFDGEGWRVRLPVRLPAEDSEWARLDVPPQIFAFLLDGVDDLRLVGADGEEVERVVVTAAPANRADEELSVFARSSDGEPEWLGLLLPGPGDAPTKLTVYRDLAAGGPVDVEGAFDSASWHPIASLPAAEHGDYGEIDVPLPPFAARLLRVRTAGVERVTATWSAGRRDGRGAPLEPLVLTRANVTGGVELSIDLRVRRAPGLRLDIDIAGETSGLVRAVTSSQPGVGFGDKLEWQPHSPAPAGLVRGAVRAREARRWIKLTVPTTRPDDVRIAALSGSMTPYRVLFRREGAREPVSLLAGKSGVAPPRYALARAAVAYGLGSPARIDSLAWPSPLRPPLPTDRQVAVLDPEAPFPWAPGIATLLFLALVVLTVIVRRGARE